MSWSALEVKSLELFEVVVLPLSTPFPEILEDFPLILLK